MSPDGRPRRREIRFESRIFLLALLTGLPGGLVALALLWAGDLTPKTRWTLALFILAFWMGFAFSLRHRVVWPLQTLSNLVAALREGDYSIRARGARRDDALGELMLEMNSLTEMLRDERLDALEATALLQRIMEEIDVAVFAFDGDRRLRLVNRAGERLLSLPAARLTGRTTVDLGLDKIIGGDAARLVDRAFPGGAGRWEVRTSRFRQGGLPMDLLVITDLSRALRQEERQAWKRIIRVIGHEMKNSLAPIRSLAGSLGSILSQTPRPEDWEEDMTRGLGVIASRSEALNRFMDAYARLARLPQPRMEDLDLGSLVRRVVRLETRLAVELRPGPDLSVRADGAQIEQLLINLIRNAVDAALETGGGVRVGWQKADGHVDVRVIDEGPGLPDSANLFVPFFTTKPGGSGIGLVLSREIAEAHGGSLSLENRSESPGCEARLRLPA